MFAPLLGILGHAFNPLDEALTSFSIEKARENAWVEAIALANAQSDQERTAIRGCLDDQSAVLARLILAPTAPDPLLVSSLPHLESITPWWVNITLPEIADRTAAPIADHAQAGDCAVEM